MGLDPGIDHMSAMQIIHRYKVPGEITSFRSHTGGLVAPESDDNPWHYKISWNPANVVKAGSAGPIFREEGEIRKRRYINLFEHTGIVEIKPLGHYAWYPNRSYPIFLYTDSNLPGTLSALPFVIRIIVPAELSCKAGLTNEFDDIPATVKTISEWSSPILPYLTEFNKKMYDQLGLFENKPLPDGPRNSAKILQTLLEKSWKMKESDRDMILMLHEFEYLQDNQNHFLRSSLVVKGENALRTAMAKTVGLPLGIAAKLILENKITLMGLHIPIIREIYEPVLEELALEGIRFREERSIDFQMLGIKSFVLHISENQNI
jgi:saccharopine dehydrogenase (NADP+, L-glutamate forming)